VLTQKVLNAVLQLGTRHPSLRGQVVETISAYIQNCNRFTTYFNTQRKGEDNIPGVEEVNGSQTMGVREILGISTLTTSLIGFLDAATHNLDFWMLEERWRLIQDCDELFSDDFLVTVETALSTMRHAPNSMNEVQMWKQYQKQYSASNRPLGAMLLRESFMRMISACSCSLTMTAHPTYDQNVLAHLVLQPRPKYGNHSEGEVSLVDLIAQISVREISRLEEGSDYLQLSSSWQKRLAHSVKALALTSLLCCTLISQEAVDTDALMSLLEASIADPSQAIDQHLVTVVLRSMAMLSSSSPATAAALGRSMPGIIVKTPLTPQAAAVAADCLLFVLKELPQDTVITTLYSLGNALSARNGAESSGSYALFNDISMDSHNGITNGSREARISSVNLLASTGSGTGLEPSAYAAVIHAIVRIATGINDSTITALALSMLIQKVGKVSMSVDLKIISEAAILASQGGASEFRAVLRLYMRLSQQGLAQNDQALLDAVCSSFVIFVQELTYVGIQLPILSQQHTQRWFRAIRSILTALT